MDYPSMYQAAVQYIKMGLAVFPLEERGKRPKTRNGFKDATTDAAQVKAWWQQWPNANIGIATGKRSGGIVVIDLDIDEDKGIDGYHTLEDWQRENGYFPDTWTAITGRGGYHLYFRSDAEVRNRAGIIDGVDVRGEGGYVVAPPSIHSNGNRYEWEYDLTPHPAAPAALRIGPFCLGGFCFASFSRAASCFSPRFSMRSLDAAACSCWLFCRNFDFGTLCPEVPDAPGSCSEPAPKAEPSGSAAPFTGSVCVWASGRGLFGFRFILHILRSGG